MELKHETQLKADQKILAQVQAYSLYRDGFSIDQIQLAIQQERGWFLKEETVQEMISIHESYLRAQSLKTYQDNFVTAIQRLTELYRIAMQQKDKYNHINLKMALAIQQEINKITGLHTTSPYTIEQEEDTTDLEGLRKSQIKEIESRGKANILSFVKDAK